MAACTPNAGHAALARLQGRLLSQGRQFTLVTQNVDGLHQAAGSKGVIELHGTRWRCTHCGHEAEERGPAFRQYPPRYDCGGPRRPGVVWFGESLPPEALLRAQRAAGGCDLFMSLGTSGMVYPAAGLIDLARTNGAKVLEVNPQETAVRGRTTWSVRSTAAGVLPRLG